jgi:hypothetical protein
MTGLLDAAPRILSFGAIGLALLLAFLAYRLLQRLTDRTQDIPRNLSFSIWGFMGLCFSMTGGAVFLQLSPNQDASSCWGAAQGDYAHSSFIKGGNAKALTGHWLGTYYVNGPDGQSHQYKYRDPSGKMVDYPPESIDLTGNRAVVSGHSGLSSGEHVASWGEGRLSTGNDLAIIYWSPEDGVESTMTGVNFLTLSQNFQEGQTLDGWWVGRNRDGTIAMGKTVWRKAP